MLRYFRLYTAYRAVRTRFRLYFDAEMLMFADVCATAVAPRAKPAAVAFAAHDFTPPLLFARTQPASRAAFAAAVSQRFAEDCHAMMLPARHAMSLRGAVC